MLRMTTMASGDEDDDPKVGQSQACSRPPISGGLKRGEGVRYAGRGETFSIKGLTGAKMHPPGANVVLLAKIRQCLTFGGTTQNRTSHNNISEVSFGAFREMPRFATAFGHSFWGDAPPPQQPLPILSAPFAYVVAARRRHLQSTHTHCCCKDAL